jgi:hypothetical protein
MPAAAGPGGSRGAFQSTPYCVHVSLLQITHVRPAYTHANLELNRVVDWGVVTWTPWNKCCGRGEGHPIHLIPAAQTATRALKVWRRAGAAWAISESPIPHIVHVRHGLN